MSEKPLLIGPAYSVYVRIARIALMEKGVAFGVEEFDVFDEDDIPANYLENHPFKRVPVLRHGEFELYETGAITRYIDEAFDGPPLQQADPKQRARMNQVIAVLDNYGYWPMVRVIYVQRKDSATPDKAAIAAAVPEAARCLDALEKLRDGADFLAGPAFTLADIHAAPMFHYFLKAPEGEELLDKHPDLADWWAKLASRPSVETVHGAEERA